MSSIVIGMYSGFAFGLIVEHSSHFCEGKLPGAKGNEVNRMMRSLFLCHIGTCCRIWRESGEF